MIDFDIELAKKGYAVGIDGLDGDARIVCWDYKSVSEYANEDDIDVLNEHLIVLYTMDDGNESILFYNQEGLPLEFTQRRIQNWSNIGCGELYMKTVSKYGLYNILKNELYSELYDDKDTAEGRLAVDEIIVEIVVPYKL